MNANTKILLALQRRLKAIILIVALCTPHASSAITTRMGNRLKLEHLQLEMTTAQFLELEKQYPLLAWRSLYQNFVDQRISYRTLHPDVQRRVNLYVGATVMRELGRDLSASAMSMSVATRMGQRLGLRGEDIVLLPSRLNALFPSTASFSEVLENIRPLIAKTVYSQYPFASSAPDGHADQLKAVRDPLMLEMVLAMFLAGYYEDAAGILSRCQKAQSLASIPEAGLGPSAVEYLASQLSDEEGAARYNDFRAQVLRSPMVELRRIYNLNRMTLGNGDPLTPLQRRLLELFVAIETEREGRRMGLAPMAVDVAASPATSPATSLRVAAGRWLLLALPTRKSLPFTALLNPDFLDLSDKAFERLPDLLDLRHFFVVWQLRDAHRRYGLPLNTAQWTRWQRDHPNFPYDLKAMASRLNELEGDPQSLFEMIAADRSPMNEEASTCGLIW